jgi:hypothetical protein
VAEGTTGTGAGGKVVVEDEAVTIVIREDIGAGVVVADAAVDIDAIPAIVFGAGAGVVGMLTVVLADMLAGRVGGVDGSAAAAGVLGAGPATGGGKLGSVLGVGKDDRLVVVLPAGFGRGGKVEDCGGSGGSVENVLGDWGRPEGSVAAGGGGSVEGSVVEDPMLAGVTGSASIGTDFGSSPGISAVMATMPCTACRPSLVTRVMVWPA